MTAPQQEQALTDERVAKAAVTIQDSSSGPIISWPGYGILFFWQLGVMQYLEHNYDLSKCTMVGSSAGSMLSVLAACDVEPQVALDLAHQLSIQHGVFERPLGLMGVWGGIVREWLHTLLPEDAASRCSGRVRIVITTLPLFQREVVTSFKDRDDLIDCCLASSHVPFLLDWQATALCRGRRCVDGSMLYILTGRCHGLKPVSQLSTLLLFDPFSDKQLLRGWNVLRCVLLCGKEGAQQLLNQGYQYAGELEKAGGLGALSVYRRSSVGADATAHSSDASAGVAEGTAGGVSPANSFTSSSCEYFNEGMLAARVEDGRDCGSGLQGSGDSVCSAESERLADAVAVIAEGCVVASK